MPEKYCLDARHCKQFYFVVNLFLHSYKYFECHLKYDLLGNHLGSFTSLKLTSNIYLPGPGHLAQSYSFPATEATVSDIFPSNLDIRRTFMRWNQAILLSLCELYVVVPPKFSQYFPSFWTVPQSHVLTCMYSAKYSEVPSVKLQSALC